MTSPLRPSRVPGALIAVMLLTAACANNDEGTASTAPASVAASAAASPASTATASPEESAAPTEEAEAATPSPSSTAGTDEPTVVLEPDTLAEVLITELVVRSKPHVGDDSEIYDPVLGEGQKLLIVDGPESASGYWWYLVRPLTEEDGDELLPFGWVSSADRDGEPWIEATEPDCPSDTSSVEALAELRPEERLVCFGGEDLTFTGEQRGCGVASPTTIEPNWFRDFGCGYGPETGANLTARFPPEVGQSTMGSQATFNVTGHFDDPRAAECVWNNPDQPEPPAEEVVVMCRTEFVVVSIEEAT